MQDLVAPAKDVLSTVYTGRDWITTLIVCGDGAAVDGYGLCTGTSMAAPPFVSGIAGLLRSASPLLGRADIRRLLVETGLVTFTRTSTRTATSSLTASRSSLGRIQLERTVTATGG